MIKLGEQVDMINNPFMRISLRHEGPQGCYLEIEEKGTHYRYGIYLQGVDAVNIEEGFVFEYRTQLMLKQIMGDVQKLLPKQ